MGKKIVDGLFILVLMLSSMAPLYGQVTRRDRVEAERVAFITKIMQLSPKQAQDFWPIHGEYEAEENKIRQRYKTQGFLAEMDETQAQEALENRLRMEDELLSLKKNYFVRFRAIVTAKQMLLFLKANAEFKQYLLDEIRRRRNNH
ncbi:MAG: hypothetical protein R2828_22435 [Saprospiraceae bacterium]